MKRLCFGIAIFTVGCSSLTPIRPLPPPPAYQAVGEMSFDRQRQRLKLYLDTEHHRYRAESPEFVYLGSLVPQSEVLVLHRKTDQYFRYRGTRRGEIERTHGRAASSRFHEMASKSLVDVTHERVCSLYDSPCERTAKPHKGCRHWTDEESGLQVWQHHHSHGAGRGRSMPKKITSYSRGYVDPELGIFFASSHADSKDGPWDTPQRRFEKAELDSELFEVPEGFVELFSEKDLSEEEEPEVVGWPEMMEGHIFEGKEKASRSDVPGPPAPRRWQVAGETWRGPERSLVELSVGTPEYPVCTTAGPPVYEDLRWFEFGTKPWDQETLAGERSRLEEGNRSRTLFFTQGGRLYRIFIHPPELSQENLIPLARRIAEKEKTKPSLSNGAPFQRLGRFARVEDRHLTFESAYPLQHYENEGVDPKGWSWYKETWKAGGRKHFRLHVTSGWHPQFEEQKLPLPGSHPKFKPLEKWDEYTRVGERSYLDPHEPDITFVRKGQLISVFAAGNVGSDLVIKIAKQIDEGLKG